jgi:hypothetical protein
VAQGRLACRGGNHAPLLPAGYRVFVLYAANGTPIMLADSREAALADAADREIETVSLH